MYRVLLERAAEKDLRKFPPDIYDRIIAAIGGWQPIRARPAAANLSAASTTGGFA